MTTQRRTPWSAADVQRLRALFPHQPTRLVAQALGRGAGTVSAKAYALGLRKTDACLREHGMRLDGKRTTGHRFVKGQQPWNLGRHYQPGGRVAESQFKPGHKPHTWRPVGTLRINSEGYLQRKLTDTRYPPRDWVCVHRTVWEHAHGPVPAGHVVVFRPGRRTAVERDIVPEALELVSRAELMRRNSFRRYGEQVAQLVQLRGVLSRQINRLAKEKA